MAAVVGPSQELLRRKFGISFQAETEESAESVGATRPMVKQSFESDHFGDCHPFGSALPHTFLSDFI
jgi:hypothetical protein